MTNIHNFTPRLEVLVATMNREDLSFLSRMFPGGMEEFEVLVVNQSPEGRRIPSESVPPGVRVIHSARTGLSASRNTALAAARGDILLFTDDDVVYAPGFARRIIEAHAKFPAEVLIFPVATPDGEPFGARGRPGERLRSFAQVHSPQISVKKSFIDRTRLAFDERFGLGARYPDGENEIFLREAAARGADIRFAGGEPLVFHPRENSSMFLEKDARFEARLAWIRRYYPDWYLYGYFLKMFFGLLRRGRLSLGDFPRKWRLLRRVIADGELRDRKVF
ncbi:MAG: glycosyltransferase family 2 protein [Chlorobi bacterium]|nr:glycosyltransferase family 2 protein [Chlorobiota bacterium]